jgi:hypothetical protein
MDTSLKYDERLLLSPWLELSAEDKSHAISLACRIAYELTHKQIPSTREMDYFTDVVTPMHPHHRSKETSQDQKSLIWWNTIRNNNTYRYDERVKAFKNAIKTLQQTIT